MNRKNFEAYITDNYGVFGENPWPKSPTYTVFRHSHNKKWFAVVMELEKTKFGISDDGTVNVVNLKCDPLLIGSLLAENGIHKAYHMNKNYWITLHLDGSLDEEKIKWLLDLSFNLTSKKRK